MYNIYFVHKRFCSLLTKDSRAAICTSMVISVIVFVVILITDVEHETRLKWDWDKIYSYQPKQVHLSFGESTSDIVVTWSTKYEMTDSFVEFGQHSFKLTKKSKRKPYGDDVAGSTQFIYRVTLPNLRPNTSYIYRCGCEKALSRQFSFHTPPSETTDWIPSLAIFGDLSLKNWVIFLQLLKDTQDRMYDAIIHNGVFAYDTETPNGAVGDKFEYIAANVPYMTCAGNHDKAYNISHYRTRLNMPGSTKKLFYSFNLGPVHFIGFSTEVYNNSNKYYTAKHVMYQYQWLKRDLQVANKPENRAKRPWIVTFGHRPIYCSDIDKSAYTARTIFDVYGLEDLFYRYGVDVEIWAHQHYYERLWPIYNYTVYNGSLEEPYHNPRAPVHITTGAAVNERNDFSGNVSAWSAFQSLDLSFTRMKAYNDTHLYLAQISGTNAGKVIDMFWLIKDKDKRGAYE